jgi:hypothetical protein
VADPEQVEEDYEAEPHLVSREVQGLEVQTYDPENEEWLDEDWTKKSALPERLRVVIYVQPATPEDEPILFERMLEIPVAPSVELHLKGPSATKKKSGRRSAPGQKSPTHTIIAHPKPR